jgi:hypothetical protein
MPLKVIRELLHLYGMIVANIFILDCARFIGAVTMTVYYWQLSGVWNRSIIKVDEIPRNLQTFFYLVMLALLGYLLLTICEKLESRVNEPDNPDIDITKKEFSQTIQTDSGDGNEYNH